MDGELQENANKMVEGTLVTKEGSETLVAEEKIWEDEVFFSHMYVLLYIKGGLN